MRRFAVTACLVLTAACQDPPAAPTPIDRQIVLAPGESIVVASQVSVRFVTVAGDSRCPGDATCITAGDATVKIDISSGTEQAQRDLHTATPQPVSFQDLRIELVSLDPYPFVFRPIPPGDYRATLRVLR
jgi:hypothetical protein